MEIISFRNRHNHMNIHYYDPFQYLTYIMFKKNLLLTVGLKVSDVHYLFISMELSWDILKIDLKNILRDII